MDIANSYKSAPPCDPDNATLELRKQITIQTDCDGTDSPPSEQALCRSDVGTCEVQRVPNPVNERSKEATGYGTAFLYPSDLVASTVYSRDAACYQGAAFFALRVNIQESLGNVSPILVRPVGHRFEIVHGHRRARACADIGLPVFAVVQHGGMSDIESFQMADRENQHRISTSPLEKGRNYKRAVDSKLFHSFRDVAKKIGVSHTLVNNVLAVANLPSIVIDVFSDPHAIQPAHAKWIHAAIKKDAESVNARVKQVAGDEVLRKKSAAGIAKFLAGEPAPVVLPLLEERPELGDWRFDHREGVVHIRIFKFMPDKEIRQIGKIVSGGAAGSGQ